MRVLALVLGAAQAMCESVVYVHNHVRQIIFCLRLSYIRLCPGVRLSADDVRGIRRVCEVFQVTQFGLLHRLSIFGLRSFHYQWRISYTFVPRGLLQYCSICHVLLRALVIFSELCVRKLFFGRSNGDNLMIIGVNYMHGFSIFSCSPIAKTGKFLSRSK